MTHASSDFDFIIEYTLMNQTIPSRQVYPLGSFDMDFNGEAPLLLLDGLYITQLVVDEGAAGTIHDVFFLGSCKYSTRIEPESCPSLLT